MYQYKDKRLLNFFKMEINNAFMKSAYRRGIFCLFGLFLVFYFYTLLAGTNNNHIFTPDVIEPSEAKVPKVDPGLLSSVILDTLVKEPEDGEILDLLPIHTLVSPYKNGMFIYNMEELIESWWTFDCIETRMKDLINTKLCIHETKYDNHISGQLRDHGLWEPTNVRSFVKLLHEAPDANVIDIGANIGLYTLIAAKMDRFVIAVEPLHENLNRMHKAAHLEGVQSRIIALVNAMSNKQQEVRVSILDFNIGGAYVKESELLEHPQERKNDEQISSSVIVNSMTADDLYDIYAEKLMNKSTAKRPISKKFVLKIDIEGYEPYAFEKARELFSKLEILAVFLEFGKTLENLKLINYGSDSLYFKKVKNMLKLFETLEYVPYEPNGINKLDYKEWKTWSWDVFLRNCNLTKCPSHEYKAVGTLS